MASYAPSTGSRVQVKNQHIMLLHIVGALSLSQPLHGIDAVQALDPMRFSLPPGLNGFSEQLESLADELL